MPMLWLSTSLLKRVTSTALRLSDGLVAELMVHFSMKPTGLLLSLPLCRVESGSLTHSTITVCQQLLRPQYRLAWLLLFPIKKAKRKTA